MITECCADELAMQRPVLKDEIVVVDREDLDGGGREGAIGDISAEGDQRPVHHELAGLFETVFQTQFVLKGQLQIPPHPGEDLTADVDS